MPKKTDLNQRDLVANLRTIPGLSVLDLSGVGKGCPDLLLGYRGQNVLLEVKNPDRQGQLLTPQQERFFENWRGQAGLVKTFEEALEALGL